MATARPVPMEHESIGGLARQVVDDVKQAARAEIGLWKAIAAFRLSGAKLGVPLLVGALFVLQSVLTALFVGLIVTLAPMLGPGWATLLVVVGGLVLVGLLAFIGLRLLRSLTTPLPEPRP